MNNGSILDNDERNWWLSLFLFINIGQASFRGFISNFYKWGINMTCFKYNEGGQGGRKKGPITNKHIIAIKSQNTPPFYFSVNNISNISNTIYVKLCAYEYYWWRTSALQLLIKEWEGCEGGGVREQRREVNCTILN